MIKDQPFVLALASLNSSSKSRGNSAAESQNSVSTNTSAAKVLTLVKTVD